LVPLFLITAKNAMSANFLSKPLRFRSTAMFRLTTTRYSSRLVYPPAGCTSLFPLPGHSTRLNSLSRKIASPSIRILSHPRHSDFKLVVIIDDSDSVRCTTSCKELPEQFYFTLLQMGGTLWSEARDALAGVAELSRLKGGEGLDMYCLNSHQYRNDLRVSCLSLFTLMF
jgi:hypothetical protein